MITKLERNKTFLCEATFESVQSIQAKVATQWLEGSCDDILEIGCSTGYFTKVLKNKGKNVCGVDINADHIELAQRKYPRIRFQTCDASGLPFSDESFDVVLMLEVLEHVQDEVRIISEIYRVLKDGGTLIMSVPNSGLFSFLDPFNVKMKLKHILPGVCSVLSRVENTQFRENMSYHRHYSLEQLKLMLQGKFNIKKVYRGGLLAFPICSAIQSVFSRVTRFEAPKILMQKAMNMDGSVKFGPLSYNLIIMCRKINNRVP